PPVVRAGPAYRAYHALPPHQHDRLSIHLPREGSPLAQLLEPNPRPQIRPRYLLRLTHSQSSPPSEDSRPPTAVPAAPTRVTASIFRLISSAVAPLPPPRRSDSPPPPHRRHFVPAVPAVKGQRERRY